MLKVDLILRQEYNFLSYGDYFFPLTIKSALYQVVQKQMFKITELYEVSHLCLNLTSCRNLLMGNSGETCLLVPFSIAHSFYCINKHYFPTFGE